MTTIYRREHHQFIALCLANFNDEFLSQHSIYFGGGTRIALELNEYRESVDIDFLCKDKAAFRAVRQQVSSRSLGELVHKEFNYGREIIFDRYGVRTFIATADIVIKLEFVAFDNYALAAGHDKSLFSVPYLDRSSCYVTKLLANADRLGIKPYKDIFDLIVMYSHWGRVPDAAFSEAYSHYGKQVVDQALQQALQLLLANPQEYAKAAAAMAVDADYYSNVIVPQARKMLDSLC